MKVEKRIHAGYKEWLKAQERQTKEFVVLSGYTPMIEKCQYIYSSIRGNISLIEFTVAFYKNHPWEIYGYNEKGIIEVERFRTKEEAEKFIYSKLSWKGENIWKTICLTFEIMIYNIKRLKNLKKK